jgi:hypothetical protein
MTRGEAPRCFTIHYEHTGFLRVATSGKTRARILEEFECHRRLRVDRTTALAIGKRIHQPKSQAARRRRFPSISL